MPDIKPASHKSIHSTPAEPAEASTKTSEIAKESNPANTRTLTKEQQDSIKQTRNAESMFAESAIKACIDPMLDSPAESHVHKQAGAAKDSELGKAGAEQHVNSHFHKRQLVDLRKGPESLGHAIEQDNMAPKDIYKAAPFENFGAPPGHGSKTEGSRPAEFHTVSKETIDAIKKSFTGDESPIQAEKGMASEVAKAAAEAERTAGIYPPSILDGEAEREEEPIAAVPESPKPVSDN